MMDGLIDDAKVRKFHAKCIALTHPLELQGPEIPRKVHR